VGPAKRQEFHPSHITHIGNFNAAGQLKERTVSVDNSEDSAADDDGSEDETPGVLRGPPQLPICVMCEGWKEAAAYI
jgi:hypothetical protein